MSFTKLTEKELRLLAEEAFAVEVEAGAKKDQIIAALLENGATYDAALQSPFFPERHRPVAPAEGTITTAALKAEPTVVTTTVITEERPSITPKVTVPSKVLLRMDRDNPRYDVRGYKFTAAHPFALVDEHDAEYITSNIDGFRYATPKEAKEFYG